jgi:hypothetical protein
MDDGSLPQTGRDLVVLVNVHGDCPNFHREAS